jgi:hypothetical protein
MAYDFERLMRMQDKHDALAVADALAGKSLSPEKMVAAMIGLNVGMAAFRFAAMPWRWGRYVMRKSWRGGAV